MIRAILGALLAKTTPRVRLKTGACEQRVEQHPERAEFFALPINSLFPPKHSAAISDREFVH